jgi:hypothetical protein
MWRYPQKKEKKMKVHLGLGVKPLAAVLALLLILVFTSCFSTPKNVEEILDFSSIPVVSSERTPIEGVWHGVGKSSFLTVAQEYTFSGNQFTLAADIGNKIYSGTRGVFTLIDSTFVLYNLESWDSVNSAWKTLPIVSGTYKIPAQKVTNTWFLENGQFSLSDGKNSIAFSKIDTPTMVLKEITATEVAQSHGFTLGGNESLITLKRVTETGRQTRIGEPEEWTVYIDGEPSKIINKHQTIAFVIPNGTHRIYVFMGEIGLAKILYQSDEITINARSNYIPLSTYLEGGLKPKVILKQD